MQIIFGIHAVEEALAARGRAFEYIAVAPGRGDARIQKIAQLSRAAGVAVRTLPRDQLTRLAKTAGHQGVVAVTAEKQYGDLEDLLEHKRAQFAFLLVLDGVEDPHNLGAIIRTAHAAGAAAVVIPERRAVGLTETVARASAGAVAYLPVVRVVNVSRALEELKQRGYWIYGLDQRGQQVYDQLELTQPAAIVLGAEGKGLHENVAKHCDFLVRIPMAGQVASLNVSVAAGVMLFEWRRRSLT
jgi:23S rRNA (guanosine2251-2'-O)-methyltransferase